MTAPTQPPTDGAKIVSRRNQATGNGISGSWQQCGTCGKRWNGLETCHCRACCRQECVVTDQPEKTERKKLTGDALRAQIRRLALDWAYLKAMMPAPSSSEVAVRMSREYGHPAEWASDMAAKIVDVLSSWHDLMAEKRNETPPPDARYSERVRLHAAWKYLEPRCDQLVETVEHEALSEIPAMHRHILNVLGISARKQVLPVPCPSVECGLRMLMRTVGIGEDFVTCGACGYTIREKYYPLLVRMALDTAMDQAS